VEWLSQVCDWLAFQILAISKHIFCFFFWWGGEVSDWEWFVVCRSFDWSFGSLFSGSMDKPCCISSYWCYIISDYGFLPLLWRGSINHCTSLSGKSCKHLLVLNIWLIVLGDLFCSSCYRVIELISLSCMLIFSHDMLLWCTLELHTIWTVKCSFLLLLWCLKKKSCYVGVHVIYYFILRECIR